VEKANFLRSKKSEKDRGITEEQKLVAEEKGFLLSKKKDSVALNGEEKNGRVFLYVEGGRATYFCLERRKKRKLWRLTVQSAAGGWRGGGGGVGKTE